MTTTFQVNAYNDDVGSGRNISSTNHLSRFGALREVAKLKKHPRVIAIRIIDYYTAAPVLSLDAMGGGEWFTFDHKS